MPQNPADSAQWKPPSARAIRAANALLIARYGERVPLARDPLDGLILIILSQATSDVNCDRAFSSLKRAFPSWPAVLEASDQAVVEAIRSGGLANQKAARIRRLLREIHQETGALDLSWMHSTTAAECEEYLKKFHGVGPKTIACVLMFFLLKPAFAVDTHVLRVTKRLGWLRPRASAEEAHRVFKALVPDECKLNLHVNLIAHGRAVCRAEGNGGPRCGQCLLRARCAFGKGVVGEGSAQLKALTERVHGGDFFVTVQAGVPQPLDAIEAVVEAVDE